MTLLDTAIKDTLYSLGITWCPSMKSLDTVIFADSNFMLPACIYAIENDTEPLSSGAERATIKFYMAYNKGDESDVLKTMEIYHTIALSIRTFRNELNKLYKSEFIGKKQKFMDTLPCLEAGISFSLNVDYFLDCI